MADPSPSPPPGSTATGAEALDVLNGFGAAVAEAFAGPLRSMAGSLAQPWQQFGQQLSASWGGVASTLATQYQAVLGAQLRQVLEGFRTEAAAAFQPGADPQAALARLRERLAAQHAAAPADLQRRLDEAAAAARAANEELARTLRAIAESLKPPGLRTPPDSPSPSDSSSPSDSPSDDPRDPPAR